MSANNNSQKPIVVTGAAQGIGYAICQYMAKLGHPVVVADIKGASDAADKLRSEGFSAIGVDADVTNEQQLENLQTQISNAYGTAYGLVNNAGIFSCLNWTPFELIPSEQWDMVFSVNVKGTMLVSKHLLPLLENNGGGRIVNIGSATAFKGSPYMLHYVASKGAMMSMTKALAAELGAKNIRVNMVAPGYTLSDGVKENPDQWNFDFGGTPASEFVRNQRVIKRDQHPDDVTGIVAFLLGEQSDFLTGQAIVADGGMHFH